MNLIKSIFISSYMMLVAGISGYSGWMLYQGTSPFAWGGVLLTTAPLVLLLGKLMLFKNMARTSARFPLLNLFAAVGTGLAVFAWLRLSAGILVPCLALIGWITFLLYAYWYSDNGREPSKCLVVGSTLLEFTLKDIDGAPVTSTLLSERPTILMFYRGNWCPLCMSQIGELVAKYKG